MKGTIVPQKYATSRTSETNGRNSSKWTGLIGLAKTLKMVKISRKVCFEKYIQMDNFIDQMGY